MTAANPSITVTDNTIQPHADFRSLYASRQQAPGLQIITQSSSFGSQTYDMPASPHLDPSSVHAPSFIQKTTPSPRPTSRNTNMPTPASLPPIQSPLHSPVDEKRRHSAASSTAQFPPRSESSPSEDDRDSRRGSTVYRRVTEPKKNHLGKLLCEYETCRELVFDRKCEWRYVFLFSYSFHEYRQLTERQQTHG